MNNQRARRVLASILDTYVIHNEGNDSYTFFGGREEYLDFEEALVRLIDTIYEEKDNFDPDEVYKNTHTGTLHIG